MPKVFLIHFYKLVFNPLFATSSSKCPFSKIYCRYVVLYYVYYYYFFTNSNCRTRTGDFMLIYVYVCDIKMFGGKQKSNDLNTTL